MSGISTGAFQGFGGIVAGGGGFRQAELPLGSIDPHPENRSIDREKVERLAETIARDGLGQLPLVRAMPNGRYQMIAGHHRLEAFRLLAQRTGEERWRSIPVNIVQDCDDERALCLLHMTNLVAPDLSKVEAGRAYEAIAAVVAREREKDPESFAGKWTNAVVAQVSAEQGKPVGVTFVKEARRAYRESQVPERRERRPRPAPPRPSEAELAADAMQRSLERLEALDASEVERVAPRLARYAKRARALARESGR